ncbi:hypothetical protein [Vallitalea maricola]|uniref:Uncharacterized protein n=1 Tax=Vallitalea maricola TaxID=3074433 RepID=A0ACB5URD0_9FIRM|nr:hypothetical protein AN2V17_44570 [Vallitalea sp. AN17-2]
MHDTFLFKKISDYLKNLCEEQNINKLTSVNVIVNHDSHVTEDTLLEELRMNIGEYLSDKIKIYVEHKQIEALTAIIYKVEGEN